MNRCSQCASQDVCTYSWDSLDACFAFIHKDSCDNCLAKIEKRCRGMRDNSKCDRFNPNINVEDGYIILD